MSELTSDASDTTPRKWHSLEAIDRRVVGVLIEKAKTTPEAYPLSLNAIRTGCNQKSNRFPMMDVELEDVEESLDRLRQFGAVAEVQGGGRVPRYRHYMYEWLGVEKAELAVMTELLLRGAQTEGELRGRVARMEPLADLNALRPVLQSLQAKGLVVSLTPAGRGHVVTHNLYQEREMEKQRREYAGHAAPTDGSADAVAPVATPPPPAPAAHSAPAPAAADPVTHDSTAKTTACVTEDHASREVVEDLKNQVETLRNEVASLRKDLDDLWSNFR